MILHKKGEIVEYTNVLVQKIEPTDPSLDYDSFTSHADLQVQLWTGSAYPNIDWILRGNFKFSEELTDHDLIRAPKLAYTGTQAGDKLQLQWNANNTRFPNGIAPFNNDATLNDAFFTGEKVIDEKIDYYRLLTIYKVSREKLLIVQQHCAVAFVHNSDNRTLLIKRHKW